MEDKRVNENKEKQKKSKIVATKKNRAIIACIFGVVAVICIISAFGFAKYVSVREGTASVDVAKMVCEMDVVKHDAERDVNPYCEVTVRNYEVNNNGDHTARTETNVSYTLRVEALEGVELPDYYWQKNTAPYTRIGYGSATQQVAVNGTLSINADEADEYRIVFINPGDREITKKVKFNISAIQLAE